MKNTNFPKVVVTKSSNPLIVQEKHRQIYLAAKELFSQKGYNCTSMRDIAVKSGINLSYIYQFIESKDDILYMFYEQLHEKWSKVFDLLSLDSGEDLVPQFEKFLKTGFKTVSEMASEVSTMYSESRHLRLESLKSILSQESKLTKDIDKFIDKGVRQGVFKVSDSYMAANIIQYLLVIYALRSWNIKKRYSQKRFIELTINFIFKGLGVSVTR
jgi:TetR/AcrR family transcriptional regulator, cholesterol catabolism regulator